MLTLYETESLLEIKLSDRSRDARPTGCTIYTLLSSWKLTIGKRRIIHDPCMSGAS